LIHAAGKRVQTKNVSFLSIVYMQNIYRFLEIAGSRRHFEYKKETPVCGFSYKKKQKL
jgi:hypothetical protein